MSVYDVPQATAASAEAGPPPGEVLLRPPRHRVDPRARHVWRLSVALGWLFLFVPLLVGTLLVAESRPMAIWATAAVGLLAAVHAGVMPELRYRVHRWEADDDAVYTRVGWIKQTSRVAPVSRIQTVDSTFGPLQRLFGVGRLTVTTASAAGPLSIDGLSRAEVEALVTRLTAVTARDAGDAT